MVNAKVYRENADVNFALETEIAVKQQMREIEKIIDKATAKGFHHCYYEKDLLFKNIKVEKAAEKEIKKRLKEAGFKVKIRNSPMDEYGYYRYYKIKW